MGPLILLIIFIPTAALPSLIPALGFIQYITPTRLVGGLALAWAWGRDLTKGSVPRVFSDRFTKAYAVFVGVTILSGLFWTLVRHQAGGVQERFTQLLSFVLFYYVVLSCVRTVRDVKRAVWVSVLAMCAFSVPSVLRFGGGGGTLYGGVERIAGLSNDPNYFAAALLLIIPMAMYLIPTTPNPVLKMLLGLCTAALLAAEVTTLSRAGIVFGLPVLFLALLAVSRRKAQALVGLGALVLAGCLLMAATRPGQQFIGSFRERLSKSRVVEEVRGVGEAELSTTMRYHLFLAGAKMTLENWPIGVGPNNFIWNSRKYGALQYNMAHNMYWSVGGELGVIGLFSFLAMIWMTLRDLRRIRRRALEVDDSTAFCLSGALFSGLVAFCVVALFVHVEAEKFFWMVLFLTVGFRRAMEQTYPETATEVRTAEAVTAPLTRVGSF